MTSQSHTVWLSYRAKALDEAAVNQITITYGERLGYMLAGLCGESEEFWRAHDEWLVGVPGDAPVYPRLAEELGDAAWYFAHVETLAETNHGLRARWPDDALVVETRPPDEAMMRLRPIPLMAAACRVAEALKRPLRLRELPRDRAQKALDDYAGHLARCARHLGGLAAILDGNVTKWRARHGRTEPYPLRGVGP